MQISESEYSHSVQSRQNSPYWALSRQLQLRLRYARLKVDHGWQKQSLNEVENLYFHHHHFRDSAGPSSSNARSLPLSPASIRLDGQGPSGSSSSNTNIPRQEAALGSSLSVFRAQQQQDEVLLLHSRKAPMAPQVQVAQQQPINTAVNTTMQIDRPVPSTSIPTPTFQLAATPPTAAPHSSPPTLSPNKQIAMGHGPRDSTAEVTPVPVASKVGDASMQAQLCDDFPLGGPTGNTLSSATSTTVSTSTDTNSDLNVVATRQDRDVPEGGGLSGGASTEAEASSVSRDETAQGSLSPDTKMPTTTSTVPPAAPAADPPSAPKTHLPPRSQSQSKSASMTYDSFFRSHDGPIPMTATALATYGYGPYTNTNTNKTNTAATATTSSNAGPTQFNVAPPGLPTQVGEAGSDVAMADASGGSKAPEV